MIRGYNGGDISYPDNAALILSPDDFPYLATKQGHDIITASGLTLLGADDKAGVAILMTAARHLLANPQIPHPKLRLAFTPVSYTHLDVYKRQRQSVPKVLLSHADFRDRGPHLRRCRDMIHSKLSKFFRIPLKVARIIGHENIPARMDV